MAEKKSKKELLEELSAKLEKDFGKGSILGASDEILECEVQSTGSLMIDNALGVGGLPKGRIVEVFGPNSSGKTTFCAEVISQTHKDDPEAYCAIIDAEHALDLDYMANLGIDLNRLKLSQPDYGEQGLEICKRMAESGLYSVIVVDSVAALVPKKEIEGEIGDSSMGGQARMMGQALRILTPVVAKSNCIVIFTNQIRDKIGVMFGSPETTSGGNALPFFASVRIDIRRSTQNKDGEIVFGNQTKIKIIKNKVAPPFKTCVLDVVYGEGFDKVKEVIDLGIDLGIIKKAGSWYSHDDYKLGQGMDGVKAMFKDNPEYYQEVRNLVLTKLKEQ